MKASFASCDVNSYTLRNLLVKLRNEGKVTLKNDVYSVVSRSQRSQCPQSECEKVGEKRDDVNNHADYGNHASVVSRSQAEEYTPVSDYSNASADYADYEAVVTHSQDMEPLEERNEASDNSPLTTLTMGDYANGHSQSIHITNEPFDIKKAAREYELQQTQGRETRRRANKNEV